MAKYNLGQLVWKITGDSSALNKELDKTDKKVAGTGKKFTGLGTIIKAGMAIGAAALGAFMVKATKAASDAQEVADKFGVVFRDVPEQANKVAQSLAENYGLARTEAKRLLSDTGDLLTGFGVQGAEALKLSEKVQKLAVDLASFTNIQGGAKTASEALTKGLFGETEMMKQLGIVINQNSAEFKNAIKTKMQSEGLTLQQAKAYTILEMATKQSTNALNNFQKTSGSMANTFRVVQATMQNFTEEIGKELLPSITELFQTLLKSGATGDIVVAVFKKIAQFIAVVVTEISRFAAEIENAILTINKLYLQFRIWDNKNAIDEQTIAQVKKWKEELIDSEAKLKKNKETLEDLKISGSVAWSNLVNGADETDKSIDKLKKKSDKLSNSLTKVGKKGKGSLKGVSDEILELGPDAIQTAQDMSNSFAGAFDEINTAMQASLGGITGMLNSFISLSEATTDARVSDLERQMEAELHAAGVAEETAVQTAQNKLQIAQAEGNQEAVLEAQNALKKAQIEEKYQKKIANAKYKGELEAWRMKVAVASANIPLATGNAIASGAQAPWFLQPGFMIALGGLAAAGATAELAAVLKTKPVKPRFQDGGIVPGTRTTGDTTLARVNAGELITNEGQQQRLLDIADGKVVPGGPNNAYRVVGTITPLWDEIFEASQDGRLLIADKAITERF